MISTPELDKVFAQLRERTSIELTKIDKNDIERYIIQNKITVEDDEDIISAVDSYLQARLERAPHLFNLKEDKGKKMQGKAGSLQSLVVYAGLQPLVLAARQEVLGTEEPISLDDVAGWLLKQSQEENVPKYDMYRVSYQVILKRSEDGKGYYPFRSSISGKYPPTIEDISKDFLTVQGQKMLFDEAPIEQWSGSTHWKRKGEALGFEGEDGKVEWVMFETEKLIRLAAWAQKIMGEYPPFKFRYTVYLILSGLPELAGFDYDVFWKALDTKSPYYEDKNWNRHRYQRVGAPYIKMTINSPELSPKEVGTFYARIRKEHDFGGQGRVITREQEILGIAALHLIWIDKLEKRGRQFYERTREKYRQIAPFYRLDAEHFHFSSDGEPKSWEATRKALERIEHAHRKFYSSDHYRKRFNYKAYEEFQHSLFARF